MFDDRLCKLVWQLGKKFEIKVYPVGGAVRDFLLGKSPADYDFLIEGKKESVSSFLEQIREEFSLIVVKPSGFDIYRLVNRDLCLDFTVLKQGETVEENLKTRDFTVNSFAFDFFNGRYLYPPGGKEDLEKRVLRSFRLENLTSDPVRILRLYRFFACLDGFEPEENTERFAVENAYLIRRTAKERIREELTKIFLSYNGYKAVKRGYPVFSVVFPFLEKIKGIPQNGYHHLNVKEHTLEVLKLCFDYKKLISFLPKFSLELSEEDKLVLRLAALFHDAGKYKTFAYNEKGITTFRNHQFESASIVLEQLSFFPKRVVERVYLLVRRHMVFLNFIINGYSEKSFRKLLNLMREDSLLLLLLFLADKSAAKGELSVGNFEKAVEIAKSFIDFYDRDKEKILNLPKLVSGFDVIRILEIAPSKKVGEVLNLITEKQLENPDFTREEALKLIYSLKKSVKNKEENHES